MNYEDAYNSFKNLSINSKKKHVPFKINFKQWCDLWGNNIEKREALQLQRIVKELGYVEGNLIVGMRMKRGTSVTGG